MGGLGLLAGQLRALLRDLASAAAARIGFKRLGREAFRRARPPLHRLLASGAAGSRRAHALGE
jgi:hypothetical protein